MMKVFLGILLFFVVIGAVIGVTCIGTYNTLVRHETTVSAQYEQNKNSYDTMWKEVKEVSQVPDMYANDLKKVFDSALQSRYGEDGSKAAIQVLVEQNPNFDSTMYRQIQQVIEASRTEFSTEQKMLIDKKRAYENDLKGFPSNLVAGLFGFPRIKMDEMSIVTSVETEDAFTTKKAKEIKIK